MDDWSPEQQLRRNKRTFTQMSQLLQPLRSQNPFIASSPHPLPDPSTFASTSSSSMPPRAGHQQHNSNNNPPDNMAHRRLPMPSLQPSLQHQASRTVIDLTDDHDFQSSQPRRSSQRSAAPPQLERSDTISLGQEQEIITIDSDDDDEIEFVSEHPLPDAVRLESRAPPPRPGNGPQNAPMLPGGGQHHNRLPPRRPRQDEPAGFAWGIAAALGAGRIEQLMGYLPQGVHYHALVADAAPRMPGMMDYEQHAFARAEARKEEFVPPPPAKEGFTRSPKEDDVVVCPACDEELVVNPMDTQIGPEKKPEKKKKSKADRAEHPFWVVRECGHVYCNKCYQKRKPDPKSPKRLFPQAPGPKKTPICAVDGCNQEVLEKKHWVGVFL